MGGKSLTSQPWAARSFSGWMVAWDPGAGGGGKVCVASLGLQEKGRIGEERQETGAEPRPCSERDMEERGSPDG